MRFQDWDILLYPKGCEVPFKEFKTTCYAVQEDHGGPEAGGNGTTPTPLLTCFVPGIPEGRPFSVSLHSWTTPGHVGLQAMPGLRNRALWQVKIVVDGVTVATQLYPRDCAWPQVITEGTISDVNGMTTVRQLGWPSFHKSSTTQRQWDAADPTGRIKVEVGAGFNEELGGKTVFTKLSTIVCFAFFPAPIGHLECVGIAWPNEKMFEAPLQTGAQPITQGLITAAELAGNAHRRNYSSSSIHHSSPMRGLPVPPPPTPAMGLYDAQALQAAQMQSLYDLGTNFPSMPGLVNGHDSLNVLSSPATSASNESYRQPKAQLQVRLPSDQLQKLILALSPPKQAQTQSSDYTHMPPPPLPFHALAAKAGGNAQHAPPVSHQVEQLATAEQGAALHSGSRGSSDISMHTSCAHFPICTSEDDSGLVVHSSPAFPSTSIKGRKEGSSPEKPRDFLSTILGPQEQDHDMASPKKDEKKSSDVSSSSPVETPGRKRTRSALKSLTLNDGLQAQKDASARKPLRKVSRASSGDSKRARDIVVAGAHLKASVFDEEDKENQMILDA